MRHKESPKDFIRESLERWGAAVVNRYVRYYDGPSAGDSVLAKQRDLGLKSRLKREEEREIVRRDGTGRRLRMARELDSAGLEIVPMWAVDPVRASNDADHPHDRAPVAVDMGIPDDLRWIERELIALGRKYPMREQILREEYTTTGSQAAKAKRVADRYEGRLNLEQYRRELYRGIEWMLVRAAA